VAKKERPQKDRHSKDKHSKDWSRKDLNTEAQNGQDASEKPFQQRQSPLLTATPSDSQRSRWMSVMIGALLLWTAFPPLGLALTSLFALVPWLWLVQQTKPLGRNDYFKLWVAGSLFWLLTLQGIRLAYWPLYAGWFALSLYLAIYVPLFVGITRIALHHWRIPLIIAAPLVWCSLELTRSYFLTGFSGLLLAHSFARVPIVLQLADQISIYGIGAWIVSINVALIEILPWRLGRSPSQDSLQPRWLPLSIALLSTISLFGYGFYRIRETELMKQQQPKLLRIALIQENAPTMFEATVQLRHEAWQRYATGTRKASERFENIQLVVWPESVYTANEPIMLDYSKGMLAPELASAGVKAEDLPQTVQSMSRLFQLKAQSLIRAANLAPTESTVQANQIHAIVGTDVWELYPDKVKRFNSAVWIDPQGQIADSYAKKHLVMFGEYFPLNGFFGILYKLFGMSAVSTGDEEKCFEIYGAKIAPSICFESMIPHHLYGQIRSLRSKGKSPDIMLNVTNDGWFRGSSMLDHHLACSIASAVENRRPMVIAANTGLSAWIDGAGRLEAVAHRLEPDQILAEPYRDSRLGLFQVIGDWPIRIFAAITWILALAFWLPRFVYPAKTKLDSLADGNAKGSSEA
jgi:apolipoprotein N-acyltransferase